MKEHRTLLVSACLVGLCTRYDGKSKGNRDIFTELEGKHWIPICPEQLGGMATPREAADISGGDGNDVLAGEAKVLTKSGEDVSEYFVRGAEMVLAIARMQNASEAILKARSPSCAVHGIIGVTAALLQREGLRLEERDYR